MPLHFARIVWLAGLAVTQTAWAAHPLVTEDTGTQGIGNAELEHGITWTRDADGRSFGFQPQLSYGVLPALDLIIQPSWSSHRSPGSPSISGFGDTALDAKWRFYGDAPLSLAVRAGLLLSTAQKGIGLPSGTQSAHVLLAVTLDAAPWTVHGNLGLTRNPKTTDQRRDLTHASAAALFAPNERWTLAVDAGIDQTPNLGKTKLLGTMLVGAIYTVRPGFDVDAGYQVGIRRDVPTRQWLLGVTYRWAP